MAELTVMLVTVLGGAVVAVNGKPDDNGGASSPRRRDTSLCLLPSAGLLLLSLFLPSPRLSLSVSLSISLLFRSLLSQHCRFVSLSVSLPVFCNFFLLLFFLSGRYLLGQGERGRPCLVPSLPMHGAHVSCSATAPAEVANGGVAYGARLLWHHIMRRVASSFGSNKARGREREEEINEKEQKLIFPCCMSRGRRRRNSAV